MYFESVFIKLKNLYINIYDINLSNKFMNIAFFLASSNPLNGYIGFETLKNRFFDNFFI